MERRKFVLLRYWADACIPNCSSLHLLEEAEWNQKMLFAAFFSGGCERGKHELQYTALWDHA